MKKRMLDLLVACICLAVFAITILYGSQIRYGPAILWVSGILCVCFLVLAINDRRQPERRPDQARGGRHTELPTESELITEAVLLSEEDTELGVWDLYGKTAAVIGRDVKENQVDIDLGQSPYASLVDVEHAVLNFSSGNWYVEDLGSANGIRIKKTGDSKIYRLSADTPCRLERGDCLYVGLNRIIFR